MSDDIHVLIASSSESALSRLRQTVGSVSGIRIDALRMVGGNADPMVGVHDRPDILIVQSDDLIETLQAVARRPQTQRPHLLVIASDPAPETVKFAVRAGARDLLSEEEPAALVSALEDLIVELRSDNGTGGRVTSVMNAKGGSGGTFIACNLGHVLATNAAGASLVVDLDFQFASLPHYLDLTPKRSLLDALAHATELDRVAVEAYVTEHSSGVNVMAPIPDSVTVADFDITDRVRTLLPLLRSRYQHIVVDVPRHVDEVSTPILKASDHVIIVLQQSLPSIRDAVRLKTTLIRELGIDRKRITVLVNRHLKGSSIQLEDIREALGEGRVLVVPNHFKSVAQAIDLGVPIAEYAPSSPVVRALVDIQYKLFGESGASGRMIPGNETIRRLKQWSPF